MMIVALSPLAKVFQPYFHIYDPKKGWKTPIETVTQPQLMKTPDRIFKEECFSIVVNREVAAFHMIYNQPKNVPDVLLRTWLTGGPDGQRCQETDCYGIVEMPLDPDTSAAMTYFVAHGTQPTKDILEAVQEAREKAKRMSHDRVMTQIRRVNHAMRRQFEINEENKQGDFVPSPTEYLCAYALAEEQTKSAAELQMVKDTFKSLMAKTATR